MWRRSIVCIALQSLVLIPCGAQHTFTPDCHNPTFPSPAPTHALGVDSKCPLTGDGGDEANQNAAKNNFCAAGSAEVKTIADLAQLQSDVAKDGTIHFGPKDDGPNKGPQVDRAPLQALGEGKLVSLTGYLVYVDQEGPEEVNCSKSVPLDPLFHDIHIELADSATADKCTGVVAEMVPHHRPDVWTADNVKKVKAAKLKVRVNGQLMFDSSHVPCQNGQVPSGNPERISLWEVHPIYQFEVCARGTCTSDQQWTPLDRWVATKHAPVRGTPATSQP